MGPLDHRSKSTKCLEYTVSAIERQDDPHQQQEWFRRYAFCDNCADGGCKHAADQQSNCRLRNNLNFVPQVLTGNTLSTTRLYQPLVCDCCDALPNRLATAAFGSSADGLVTDVVKRKWTNPYGRCFELGRKAFSSWKAIKFNEIRKDGVRDSNPLSGTILSSRKNRYFNAKGRSDGDDFAHSVGR